MSDLRAMLGDRYDDVITKATKRALLNYPNLPISIPQHEALAGQALAAVLPDLLDQLARIDAILARSDQACEPSFCDWKRDIRDIREVRGL